MQRTWHNFEKKRELSSGSVTESSKSSLSMFSGILTDNDLERDPGKIEAIEGMPEFQILDDAQHLNSFATYLSNFMPELSDGMKPLSAFWNDFFAVALVAARLQCETS